MNNTFVSLLGDAKTRLVAFLLAARLFGRLVIQSARSAAASMLTTGKCVSTHAGDALNAFYAWLDAVLFPRVVVYATHPLVILGTMLSLVPLVVFATLTAFVLVGNTYLNVCSAAVSSIVLMQSLKHHRDNTRMHDQHAREIAKLHEKLDDLTNRQ